MTSIHFRPRKSRDAVHSARHYRPPPFSPGEADNLGKDAKREGKRWFFNMRVDRPPSPPPPREAPEGPSSTARDASVPCQRPGRAGKVITVHQGLLTPSRPRMAAESRDLPRFRFRKLAAFAQSPSPAELREQMDQEVARSIGNTIIFHNLPRSFPGSLEEEVIRFCKDYFVGQRVNGVQFSDVHHMERRFDKDAPIIARFRLLRPWQADQPQEAGYQPFPYVPEGQRRKMADRKIKINGKLLLNRPHSNQTV